MSRRKTKNHTGIDRLPEINSSALWIVYTCVQCSLVNSENIGEEMLNPKDAFENCEWVCKRCKFKHSRQSDLPKNWKNWAPELKKSSSPACQNFWKSFFTIATEKPECYWKQCKTCGLTLPFGAFSRHVGWGALEKQLECRACKGAINAKLNPKRTTEQLREGSIGRRIGDLFAILEDDQENKLDIKALFKRFNNRCFKTKRPLDINKPEEWHIDHILPATYFYPLTVENACLLSKEANENKKSQWPSKFYSPKELIELAQITGANLELLSSKTPIQNKNIDVNKAVEKWLDVRNSSDLTKRISEIKIILKKRQLISKLSPKNKKILGF